MANASSERHGWRIGDWVSLCPNGRESDRCEGVVVGLDEPGLPRGVRVRFSFLFSDAPRLVRGVDNCYASHDELTLIKRGEPEGTRATDQGQEDGRDGRR